MVQWDDTTFGFFTSSVVNPKGLLFDQLTMAIKLSQSDDESKKGKERRVSSQRLVRLIFCMSLIYVGREVIFNPYLSYLEITPKDDQSTSGTTGTVEDIGRRLDLAIFYNIFISPKNVDFGLSIVQEQLDLRKRHPHLSNVPLYYTKIGAHNYSFPRSCEPCEELTAVEDGTEQITLQFLYEYCQRYPTTGRVIYIHNKGSFTNTPTNERLRITLTRGSFSAECAQMPQGQCDICSAQLSLIPVPHTSGNMFVAECDYIVKLIPPEKFTLRKEDLVAKLWNTSWEDLGMPPYANLEKRNRRQIYRKLMVGLGRYAMEQWPHSHPTVRPCEVFNETFSYNQPPKFPWQLKAERRTAPQAHDFSSQLGGFHPWFHLPGRLYEYRAMYSQVPPNDSWVYRAYPPF